MQLTVLKRRKFRRGLAQERNPTSLRIGAADLYKQLEETTSTYKVEGLREIDKGEIQGSPLFPALLLQLPEGKDHVHCGSCCPKATLRLRVDAICKEVESSQGDTGEDLLHDVEQGDAAVIITVTAVSLVFIQCDDLGVTQVLGDSSITPTETDEVMKVQQQGRFPKFDDVRCCPVSTWGLAASEAVNGFAELFLCGFLVKLLHDRQVCNSIQSLL